MEMEILEEENDDLSKQLYSEPLAGEGTSWCSHHGDTESMPWLFLCTPAAHRRSWGPEALRGPQV